MSGEERKVSPEVELAAVTALYQSEISANIGDLQAATSITLGLLAYLSVTLFAMDSLASGLLPLLPLAVIFACFYQMLRAAVVVRRAALARAYERRIARLGGFLSAFKKGTLGSQFYGEIDDIDVIRSAPGPRKAARLLLAVSAYLGLYVLSVLYTGLVMSKYIGEADPAVWAKVAWCVVYVFLWLTFLVAAASVFKPKQTANRGA